MCILLYIYSPYIVDVAKCDNVLLFALYTRGYSIMNNYRLMVKSD